MTDSQRRPETGEGPLIVSHVADSHHRYPGETVTLFTRVDVVGSVPGFKLGITIPEGLTPVESIASDNYGDRQAELVLLEGTWYLLWRVDERLRAGQRFEFRLAATVSPSENDRTLESRAKVIGTEERGRRENRSGSETVSIAISAKARYLKYLPAIYTEQDDFMGRFLMLFESFWGPIENQIDLIHYYFDPKFTPKDLLPWLATWVDLVVDKDWSEEQRRVLLSRMLMLYRRRGTRRGLQEYLEIYTGQRAQITEHRAYDLQLGTARLGSSIALGKKNMPHTFTVTLNLPRARSKAEKDARRSRIEAIIESERPVHTGYTLKIVETT